MIDNVSAFRLKRFLQIVVPVTLFIRSVRRSVPVDVAFNQLETSASCVCVQIVQVVHLARKQVSVYRTQIVTFLSW